MSPSQASPSGVSALAEQPPAVSLRFETLTARSDFQRASRAPRVATDGFILQMRKRGPREATGLRVGFTCSKKVGNAVMRNRAKRRLREIARVELGQLGRKDTDYVLIGRLGTTANLPFGQLQNDLRTAIRTLHGKHL